MAIDVPELFQTLAARAAGPASSPATSAATAGLRGLPSICSSNEFVIEGAMRTASRFSAPLLVECTSNQVNQDGGYTGMRPADFRDYLFDICRRVGFPSDEIILGADHFGPNPWQSEPANVAMDKARELVRLASAAGFSKIHLDASMPLSGETYGDNFTDKIIAERQADLAKVAESSWSGLAGSGPVYVVGSEVPIPGGTHEAEALTVTRADDFVTTVEESRAAFLRRNLSDAWKRVVAVVVQPGVEFGSFYVETYAPDRARELIHARREIGSLLFEGHSTDYQTEEALSQLVTDGVGVLKVGPALSFAVREALFLLQHAEAALAVAGNIQTLSDLSEVLEAAMIQNPDNWRAHYHGKESELAFARRYSLSDRCRYYWNVAAVQDAVEILLSNLESATIPTVLASQYFPWETEHLRGDRFRAAGMLPRDLINARVDRYLAPYFRACGAEG